MSARRAKPLPVVTSTFSILSHKSCHKLGHKHYGKVRQGWRRRCGVILLRVVPLECGAQRQSRRGRCVTVRRIR